MELLCIKGKENVMGGYTTTVDTSFDDTEMVLLDRPYCELERHKDIDKERTRGYARSLSRLRVCR